MSGASLKQCCRSPNVHQTSIAINQIRITMTVQNINKEHGSDENFPTRARVAPGRWVCRFLCQVWYVLEQVPWFLQNALPVVGNAFTLFPALFSFAFVFYCFVRFVLWIPPLRP